MDSKITGEIKKDLDLLYKKFLEKEEEKKQLLNQLYQMYRNQNNKKNK